MQNRKFFATLTAAIALTAGLASCSNNDDELNPKNEGRIPITLTSNVGSRATDQSLQETQIANGVLVGGYINQGDSKLADLQLTSNGNGSFTGDAGSTEDANTALNIYAYAPSYGTGVNATQPFTFAIKEDQSGDDANGGYIQSDLMIAKSEGVTPTSSPISLTFEHKMAKLNLYFDLTGATGVTLDNATVSVLQVVPSVTVDLANATVTTGTGSQVDIIAAKEVSISSDTKACVVFPSQTINSGADFVRIVAGDKTYTAKLPSNVEFKSGMKYAYTVKFTTSGEGGDSGSEGTTIQLVPGVKPWGDGMLEQYQVGDYVTSDGTIIPKAEAAIHEKRGDIVAVIFSKEVSETDKKDGYNAYAMDLQAIDAQFDDPFASEPQGTVKTPVAGESITNYSDALNDLDGLTKTQTAIDWYSTSGKAIPEGSIFNKLDNSAPISSMLCSNWFVPSFGQMVQFLNEIGGAGITEELAVSEAPSAPYYTQTNGTSLYTKFTECANNAGKSAFIQATNGVYVTVTEAQWTYEGATNVNFWCFQTYADNRWSFGRNPGKGGTNRKLLRCVAIQLPTASTPIPATEATE